VAIGSGDKLSRPENEAFGLPYYRGEDRVRQLIFTLDVVRAYLHEPRVSRRDRYGTIEDLPASPRTDPPPAVWAGGRSPELLEVAGRLADGWNAWGATPQEFALESATVARAAAGKPLEMCWGGLVLLGADDREAEQKVGLRDRSEYVVGGPATVSAHLSELVRSGAHHLVVTFPDAARPEAYERLAGDVRAKLEG
jgi:alkanesulfonate monooxygenase SsuD/methylene tetrahydromethanopterin reductase-like flavin-dependent oxidoreductase (luciferase family)